MDTADENKAKLADLPKLLEGLMPLPPERMSLRDQFAMAALTGLNANPNKSD